MISGAVIAPTRFTIGFGMGTHVQKFAIGSHIAIVALKTHANGFPLAFDPSFGHPSSSFGRLFALSAFGLTFDGFATAFVSFVVQGRARQHWFDHLNARL